MYNLLFVPSVLRDNVSRLQPAREPGLRLHHSHRACSLARNTQARARLQVRLSRRASIQNRPVWHWWWSCSDAVRQGSVPKWASGKGVSCCNGARAHRFCYGRNSWEFG